MFDYYGEFLISGGFAGGVDLSVVCVQKDISIL
jgi:hypothetical protein